MASFITNQALVQIPAYGGIPQGTIIEVTVGSDVNTYMSWNGYRVFIDLNHLRTWLNAGLVSPILSHGEESARAQIERLATFILQEVPGEPSQDAGAVDTAIRILRAWMPSEAPPAPPEIELSNGRTVWERLEENHD